MFDAVRNNKWISQAILGLIAITFAFFGLESYVRNAGSDQDVAKIGDIKISQQEFQLAAREQQEQMRSQLGESFDPKILDTPEARQAILDDLINKRLLQIEAAKRRLVVSDEALNQFAHGIEAFQVGGRFSTERYEAVLKSQGKTPVGFEAQLRQDLAVQQLANAIVRSSFAPNAVADRILALQTEKREVSEIRLALDDYLGQVKLAEGAAKRYYDENSDQFRQPEQGIAEYVVLSLDDIGSQAAVSEDDIKAWYDSHRAQYERREEERRASHILIASEKPGVDKARAKAEEVLAEVRKNPGRFAELARKYSDDPGSAKQGGDLGLFGRKAMDKSFEDAAFALGEGKISGVVQSDFGFHIIKLTGIYPPGPKPLAEVHSEIASELKKAAAARQFAEAAETFKTMVYEQADSLEPVAEKFKLKIVRSDWLGRHSANPGSGPLASEKLLAALFSEDSVKNRSNTETVEIAPNTLAAARLVDYKAATQQPFDSLQTSIETLLRRQEAQALAVKDGEARLEALKKGEDKLRWSAEKTMTRLSAAAEHLPPAAVAAVFRMDADKLPAYTGVALPGSGYTLYRLKRVEAGAEIDTASRKAFQGQLENFAAREEMREYLAALRERYKVEVHLGALENTAGRE
ncbi:MAG: SurA N-terminal domain-containing protein [Azonexus sp.]|jgi:peptidyl-prolyl cis-trans isomerase D|nr:SurA N-terminal domain-containing protein [Azonexus sp.]